MTEKETEDNIPDDGTIDGLIDESIIGETERLYIREIPMSDTAVYRDLLEACGGAVAPDLLGLTPNEFDERHEAYIKYQYGFYGYGMWGLYLKSDDSFAGAAGVWNGDESEIGEVGYAVIPSQRGKGLASEAMSFICEYALEDIGFKGLTAQIKKDNAASLRIARKLPVEVKQV